MMPLSASVFLLLLFVSALFLSLNACHHFLPFLLCFTASCVALSVACDASVFLLVLTDCVSAFLKMLRVSASVLLFHMRAAILSSCSLCLAT